MTNYRSRIVREAYAYGGVPENEAYGRTSNIRNRNNTNQNGVQYAQYNLQDNEAQPVNNENFDFTSNLVSAQNLIDRAVTRLARIEGSKNHAYIDSTWNKTVGIGENVDDWNTFNSVNWKIGDIPATEEQKRVAFNMLQSDIIAGRQNIDAEGKVIKNDRSADSYSNYSPLTIDATEKYRLLNNHLTKDTRYLYREFPEFDTYPRQLQDVLLDIKFNTGNVSRDNWPILRGAIDQRNLDVMAVNVNREDVNQERNNWARDQILSIENW